MRASLDQSYRSSNKVRGVLIVLFCYKEVSAMTVFFVVFLYGATIANDKEMLERNTQIKARKPANADILLTWS